MVSQPAIMFSGDRKMEKGERESQGSFLNRVVRERLIEKVTNI